MSHPHARFLFRAVPLFLILATGCVSPERADQGALIGGLLGAGTGALIGDASGNAAAGAAIGAGVGAITGAVVGNEIDEVEARNRAQIEAQLGRQIRPGAVTVEDVVMMSQSGVQEELIVNHIRANGMVQPPNTQDLIYLSKQGVGSRAVAAMQEPPRVRQPETVVVRESRPVIVHEVYGPPVYHYPPPYYGHRHCYGPRPGVSWGMSFSN
ncbi:MAG: glycine zipper domain-containing protein [Thermoguttaceae bacterium]